MKTIVLSVVGVIGSTIAYLFGGWDKSIMVLLVFMGIDYVTGLIVAGVFHKSKKTENGGLESRAGFKGLIRKCEMLLFVLMGNLLDLLFGADYVRTAVCIGFITNELISIIENGGLMGIPIPKVLTDAIEILNKKGEEEDG